MNWIVCGSRCALRPWGEFGESAIGIRRRAGRRSKRAYEWRVGCEGRLQLVVEREDALFRAVHAVGGDVLFLHDREGLHDVRHRVARGGERLQEFGRGLCAPIVRGAEVEMEERSVEFAADLKAALGVVAKHGAIAFGPKVAREGRHVVSGGGEFKSAAHGPPSTHYPVQTRDSTT